MITMKNKCLIHIIIFILVAGYGRSGLTQETNMAAVAARLDSIVHYHYQEKVLLDLDKPFYFAGEDIRFAAYIMDGASNTPTGLSKVVNVELLDINNNPVARNKYAIKNSTGSGIIPLPASLPSGNYLIRAYTRCMRNMPPELYYYQQITIVNYSIADKHGISEEPDKLIVNFRPEGGSLVEGMKNQLFVHLTDTYHHPIEGKWILEDDKGDSLTTFFTNQSGLGSLKIKPAVNRTYHISYGDSTYHLPRAKKKAVGLHIKTVTKSKLDAELYCQPEYHNNELFYVLLHAGGHLLFRGTTKIEGGKSSISIPITKSRRGIAQLCIIDSDNKLLADQPVRLPVSRQPRFQIRLPQTDLFPRDFINLLVKTDPGALINASVYPADLPAGEEFRAEEHIYYKSEIGPLAYKSELEIALGIKQALRSEWKYIWNWNFRYPYLPELRGQTISGKIKGSDKISPNGSPFYLAHLGRSSDIRQIAVLENGEFYVAPGYVDDSRQLIFISEYDNEFQVTLKPSFSEVFANYAAARYHPVKGWMPVIKREMIYKQLREIYTRKPANPENQTKKFYGKPDEVIQFSEYIKLPVMEEFFRELSRFTIFTKKNNQLKLNVLGKKTNRIIGPDPVYLVDGIPVFSTQTILDIDPEQVQAIKVLAGKYVYGNMIMDGIIDIETKNGDASVLELSENVATYRYNPLSTVPAHITEQQNRAPQNYHLPDPRSVICWQPHMQADARGNLNIRFQASDHTGKFIVKLTVITQNGSVKTYYRKLVIRSPR